jgi:multiple sugar transport system permease protein
MKKRKFKIGLTIAYIVLIIYAVISLFPFFWSALVSFTPMNYTDETGTRRGVNIMEWPPSISFFTLPPTLFKAPASGENYAKVFEITPYGRWIINTVLYAVLVTFGHLLFDAFGGYAFARLKFPLKNFWFTLFLATMMIPGQVTLIPQYNLMVSFGFINTFYGLVLPKLTGVFGLFLMKQFFTSIPRELEEAAKIDGAGYLKTYFKIILPMAKPAITALGIYIFLGTWNDFLWPLLMTSDKSMYTLTVGLDFFKSSYYTFWQYMMSATIMMTIPMIVIFLSFQKNFVDTGASTAVKG